MKHTARRPVRTNAALLVATAATAALTLGGCSSRENRLAEFRDDPTPDLITMHERGDDISNRLHLIKDESRRMLVRDWLYFWYLDRPTRLRPSPSAW